MTHGRCHENASDCLRLDRCGGDAGDTSTCRLLRGLPSRHTMPGVLRSVPAILWSVPAILWSAAAILWSIALLWSAAAILWSIALLWSAAAILWSAILRPRPQRGSFLAGPLHARYRAYRPHLGRNAKRG